MPSPVNWWWAGGLLASSTSSVLSGSDPASVSVPTVGPAA